MQFQQYLQQLTGIEGEMWYTMHVAPGWPSA